MTCGISLFETKCPIICMKSALLAVLHSWVMGVLKMRKKIPPYDVIKTTQAAALFLSLSNGRIRYMKLVKLLYNADKEALHRWGRPITYDALYSLPHGLVLSETLDKAQDPNPVFEDYWDEYIERKGWDSVAIADPGDSELSDGEVELIMELFEKYKKFTQFDMEDEHHDASKFPEWTDPGGTSIPIEYEAVLAAIGFDPKETEGILSSLEEADDLRRYRER